MAAARNEHVGDSESGLYPLSCRAAGTVVILAEDTALQLNANGTGSKLSLGFSVSCAVYKSEAKAACQRNTMLSSQRAVHGGLRGSVL